MTALVLASGSRTRSAMLERAGVPFSVDVAHVDEDEAKRALRANGANAADTAETLAEMKALKVSRRHPGALVIGADQMLECGEAWFDKPPDRDQAKAQLQALSGRTHNLIAAAVAAENGNRVWHHVDRVEMTVRPLSETFVDAYLDAAGDAVLGSVGAYQLEGLGAQLFSRIRGDFFTVLGLPLLPLLDYLRVRGVIAA